IKWKNHYCSDIRILLSHFLPRRDVTTDEVMRQMDVRHRKRQSNIDSAQRTKENQSVSLLDGLGDKVEITNMIFLSG
ncbi:hypothetical protein QUF74_07765, partial [Candidatus Halobeggiatoa sp. HSG11]|nr:hypothetical protein [Candidatus Halobeggiatoa sp. HSG11]